MDNGVVIQMIFALLLGALIGLERGIHEKIRKRSSYISMGDVRTFSLICFLGAIFAFLGDNYNSPYFLAVGGIIVSLFIIIYYSISSIRAKQYGLATELSAISTFFVGVFIMMGHWEMGAIFSVIIIFLLSLEGFVDNVIANIGVEEMQNTIKFAMIVLVVLPLLPDTAYSIADLLSFLNYEGEITNNILTLKFFNPYGIWFFVVLMAGISYVGYILSRIIGEKGSIVVSGAVGGLISSTAVTAANSESSKIDIENSDLYVVSTLLASTIMFIRVITIVLLFNINLLGDILLPSILMLLGMLMYILFLYFRSKDNKEKLKKVNRVDNKLKSKFSIGPALKFAGFVVIIKFISGLGSLYQDVWGDYFFYALGIISGLADVDAISQTMAVDSLNGNIGMGVASMTIIIAVISNNLVKGGMAKKFGEAKFGTAVLGGFIVSMIFGIIGLVIVNLI